MKVNNILNYLEQRFPYELAADFDLNKIGLSIGDGYAEVKGILCALDITAEVIDEAIKNNCNLILSHHPLTFSPITKVLLNDEKGSLIIKLIKNDINVISMHTNMDLGKDGVGDTLCKMFDLKEWNKQANIIGDILSKAPAFDKTLNCPSVKFLGINPFTEGIKVSILTAAFSVIYNCFNNIFRFHFG